MHVFQFLFSSNKVWAINFIITSYLHRVCYNFYNCNVNIEGMWMNLEHGLWSYSFQLGAEVVVVNVVKSLTNISIWKSCDCNTQSQQTDGRTDGHADRPTDIATLAKTFIWMQASSSAHCMQSLIHNYINAMIHTHTHIHIHMYAYV